MAYKNEKDSLLVSFLFKEKTLYLKIEFIDSIDELLNSIII